MRNKGIENVFQLEGGVHRYLDAFPEDGGYWYAEERICVRSSGCSLMCCVLCVGVGVGVGVWVWVWVCGCVCQSECVSPSVSV